MIYPKSIVLHELHSVIRQNILVLLFSTFAYKGNLCFVFAAAAVAAADIIAASTGVIAAASAAVDAKVIATVVAA